MAHTTLSLRLPALLRARLQHLAEATGQTESDLARQAIEDFLMRHAKQPTCFDIAEQAGLIGCVESGRRDLSTNPKYINDMGE